jgi:hypothetical protein
MDQPVRKTAGGGPAALWPLGLSCGSLASLVTMCPGCLGDGS